MHIAIVTTSVADRKQTERLLKRANLALSEEIGTLYIDSYGDDASFLHACMKYDMFLLDFEDISHSYKICDELTSLNVPGKVVLCQNENQIIDEAYQTEKNYVLQKPILTASLHALLKFIFEEVERKKQSHCLIEFRSEVGTQYVEKETILYARYFEKEHKVEVHLENGEIIIYFTPRNDLDRCLGDYPEFELRFKTFFVNKNQIASETNKSITMSNGDVLEKNSFKNPFSKIL